MLDEMETMLPPRGVETVRVGPDEPDRALRFAARTDADVRGRPALAALPGAASATVRFARIVRRIRPDVVNMHFVMGEAVYPILLRRAFGYRVVLSAHGGDLLRPTAQMRAHMGRVLRAADAVTAVSRELADVARQAMGGDRRLHYIANGVDTSFWSPAPDGHAAIAGRIVAMGRLLPIKGFDLLIGAMPDLPDATLDIYGEGEGRGVLEAQVASLGLSDRVRLRGHARPEVIRSAFRDASVFAMPSRGEGMPLALIEAMACGCPAVATGVGGIPDVLTPKAGVVIPPEDPRALATALREVLARPAGSARSAARTGAEAFDRARCYDAYAALIASLARPRAEVMRAAA